MSNLIRWEPMREMITLKEAMDRLFNDAFTRPLDLVTAWHMPAIDMYQTEDNFIVNAALPGLKARDVQISVTGNTLSVKGELKEKEEIKEKDFHIREQRYGTFERTLSLPTAVVADKAKVEFEDGILTITLPKAEEVKPKTITVKPK